MQLEFGGDCPTLGTSVISQIILVKPLTTYRLRFFARTGKLVTGGLPLVVARIAGAVDQPILAQSKSLPSDSREWQEHTLEFKTDGKTDAVHIGLEREKCLTMPCPIFGRLWLDDFTLEEL